MTNPVKYDRVKRLKTYHSVKLIAASNMVQNGYLPIGLGESYFSEINM